MTDQAIKAAKEMRDEAVRLVNIGMYQIEDYVLKLAQEFDAKDATIARLSAQVEAARLALEPFARVSIPDDAPDGLWTHCKAYEQDMDDETLARLKAYDPALISRKMNLILWIDGHPIRDFRRARAVLAKLSEGDHE